MPRRILLYRVPSRPRLIDAGRVPSRELEGALAARCDAAGGLDDEGHHRIVLDVECVVVVAMALRGPPTACGMVEITKTGSAGCPRPL